MTKLIQLKKDQKILNVKILNESLTVFRPCDIQIFSAEPLTAENPIFSLAQRKRKIEKENSEKNGKFLSLQVKDFVAF